MSYIPRKGPARRLSWVAAAACVLAVGLAAEAAEDGPLQVGTGVRIITPQPLLPISGGLGPTAAVREQRGELTARAVVFQRADVRVALVSLDLLGFPSVLGDRVRSQVKGIPAENILISATHTHSAPDCYGFPDGQGGHTGDLKYMEHVCAKTAEAISAAIENLRTGVGSRLRPARLAAKSLTTIMCPISTIAA